MQRCHTNGHFVQDGEIVLGLGGSQTCIHCANRLKIPYKHPITGQKINFHKPSVLYGRPDEKRGRHLRQEYRNS